ncbi:MAG TPA: DUF177 domain-containing protein [Armatimonadota bacterium]|nr:DUF177 domain-containing protein [Armatimonadota bacterium]
MRYDKLGQLTKHRHLTCAIDEPPPDGTGVEVVGHIVGEVELIHTGERDVVARGKITGEAVSECSRCVKSFAWPIEIDFTEDCTLREIDNPEGYEVAEDEEDLVPILDEDIIDLSELLRQLIGVEAPISPLCDEDCEGLCAACGADLNDGDCGCPDAPTDPRWDKLKQLL